MARTDVLAFYGRVAHRSGVQAARQRLWWSPGITERPAVVERSLGGFHIERSRYVLFAGIQPVQIDAVPSRYGTCSAINDTNVTKAGVCQCGAEIDPVVHPLMCFASTSGVAQHETLKETTDWWLLPCAR